MKIIATIVLFFLLQVSFSQEAKFSATINKPTILIGEPFEITLKAFVDEGSNTAWPGIDSMPHFEILSQSKIDSQSINGTLILNQVITVTSWDSGKWNLPSFILNGSKTAPISIIVSFASFDSAQDYHDVKDILEVPKPQRKQWWWYVAGALLLLVLFILLFPGRKTKTELAPAITNVDVYKKSLAQIDALQKNKPADAKLLYTELIHIFRVYVAKRKNIQSDSKTTGELSTQLQKLTVSTQMHQALKNTLSLSDLVKFARYQPTTNETEKAIEAIKQGIIEIEKLK